MTTVSGDVILRDRDDGAIPEKPPEAETYSDYVGTVPVIVSRPAYSTDKDGNIVITDTRPAPLHVETAEDGTITVRVPV